MELPSWINPETWKAFLEMRRKKKVPNTEYAMKLILNKLERFREAGYGPNTLLDESIERGWTSVFEPRQSFSAPSNSRLPFSSPESNYKVDPKRTAWMNRKS